MDPSVRNVVPMEPDALGEQIGGVAALAEPIGETIESSIRPNGLEVLKVRVPLGVVFFIYESRPNVTADAAAICGSKLSSFSGR